MAGLSDAAESSLLQLLFRNTAFANIGDAGGLGASASAGNVTFAINNASGFADTDANLSNGNVISYTGYANQTKARGTAEWTVSGTAPTQVVNANAVQFGNCTAGSATAHAVGISMHPSATSLFLWQNLTADLAVSVGVNPQFAASAFVVTCD